MIELQRSAGNRAVAALLARQPVDGPTAVASAPKVDEPALLLGTAVASASKVDEAALLPGTAVASSPKVDEPALLPGSAVRPRVQVPPGPMLGIAALEPEKPERRAKEEARAYWERLMDYHDRWGCWPWERHLQPQRAEYVYEVDPEQEARDLLEYRRAQAILRREAELPDTQELKGIFMGAAKKAGVSASWYEQLLTDPVNALDTIRQETPKQLCEMVNERAGGNRLSEDKLAKMSTEELLELLLEVRVITQSCGQTAGLLHEVLSPSTVNTPATQTAEEVRRAIRSADDLAATARAHRYVRIEGGGHAFIVEVAAGRCRIYQSFWGATTFASDLARDKRYYIDEFLRLLSFALVPSAPAEPVAPDVEAARRELFNSVAVHPGPSWQVTEFGQEPGAAERLAEAYTGMAPRWGEHLARPATEQLATPAPQRAPEAPSGTVDARLDDPDWLFYGSDGKPVKVADLQRGATYYVHYAKTHSLEVKVLAIDPGANRMMLEIG